MQTFFFPAAKSDGAIRQLLRDLKQAEHALVADTYVQVEASRNIAAKADEQAVRDLEALHGQIEVSTVQFAQSSQAFQAATIWIPEKDRPVLLAVMGLVCDVLVTGNCTHFGPGYGKRCERVTVCSPRQLAELV
jgi:uncharacterized protein